jgi:hypothetical protein
MRPVAWVVCAASVMVFRAPLHTEDWNSASVELQKRNAWGELDLRPPPRVASMAAGSLAQRYHDQHQPQKVRELNARLHAIDPGWAETMEVQYADDWAQRLMYLRCLGQKSLVAYAGRVSPC